MWSEPLQDSSDNPELDQAKIGGEQVVKPVRLHIRLNHHKSNKRRHSSEGHKKKKRSKYICRKCNIPRFRGKLLFRQHLISHINNTKVNVALSRLKLPEKVVIRASKYYAKKYPAGDLDSHTLEPFISTGSLGITTPKSETFSNSNHSPTVALDSQSPEPSTSTGIFSATTISETLSNNLTMANIQKLPPMPVLSENADENTAKELMEELGIQMNKLAGSFFRNDLQNVMGNSSMQHANNSVSPHVLPRRSPPPLVVDSRSAVEIQSNVTSSPGSLTIHSYQMQKPAVSSQSRSSALPPPMQQATPLSVPSSNGHSSQISMQASSPKVAPCMSPVSPTASGSISSPYHVSSPQSNVPNVMSTSPRMSPLMTPPLLQRAGLSPHLPSHMNGTGNASQTSSHLPSTLPSAVVPQSFLTSTVSMPVNRPSILMSNSNVPNERCDSVMIIEKPSVESGQQTRTRIARNLHHSQKNSSVLNSSVSISQIQSIRSTSTGDRNPLTLLRQLDPAKSMPANISLQATSAIEEQARPASVMILENPRDNPTPKFNIGNVVSLAPGYNNQMFAATHLLQDITSSCSCSTCTDIRSGDLIRKAQIMIQAGHYEYKCPKCVRRFAHKSSLLRHTRSADHGYVCDLCSSGFLEHAAFECHKRLHKEKMGILPTAAASHQMSSQHPGANQLMHPPPPPLLSSMNRRLIGNSGANMTQMAQQKQALHGRPDPKMLINNKHVTDDDVVVVGIERRQKVLHPAARLPPPPPLERAPRPSLVGSNNRLPQEHVSMASFSRSTVSNSSFRNMANHIPPRNGNVPSKTTSTPLPVQSQLARIFNNSEITLTPISNEGSGRRLEGITITPMPATNVRQQPTVNSNASQMGSGGHTFSPRVQLGPRTNSNLNPRFSSPTISNVRHVAPVQPNPPRAVSMTNMNQVSFSNSSSRMSFNPQMQNTRMQARVMSSAVPTRANQPSNILNSEYLSHLSTTMRQNSHSMNSNRSNQTILPSRSEAGTHTAYRMMPVANPSHVQLQQSNQQPKKASVPMWHHPVSAEMYSANRNPKNNIHQDPTRIQNMIVGNATRQANIQLPNHLGHQNSSSVLPSSNHSRGPNRFPVPPVQQVQDLNSSSLQLCSALSMTSSGSPKSVQMTELIPSDGAQRKSAQEALTQLSRQINCPFCNEKFNSSAAVQEHYRQQHNSQNHANESMIKLTCSKCHMNFSDKLSFEQHQSSCQEKIPCIRCNAIISQDQWAVHCAEFHSSEPQSNLSTITITNPFESNSESGSHAIFAPESNGSITNATLPLLKGDSLVQHTSVLSNPDLEMASGSGSSDNIHGLNDQAINSDTPTDDDVLVHDLSLAAASEIQLINDTVNDISENGIAKISDGKPSSLAGDFCKIQEDEPSHLPPVKQPDPVVFQKLIIDDVEGLTNVITDPSFQSSENDNSKSSENNVKEMSGLNAEMEDLLETPAKSQHTDGDVPDIPNDSTNNSIADLPENEELENSISNTADSCTINNDILDSSDPATNSSQSDVASNVNITNMMCENVEEHSSDHEVPRLSLDLDDDEEQRDDENAENHSGDENGQSQILIDSESCNRLAASDPEADDLNSNSENVLLAEKSFLCPICDQSFDSKNDFLRHIQIHQSPRHTCHLCNSSFGNRKNLVLHLRSHMKSCSKTRRQTFASPLSKRPRRDSENSFVGIENAASNSKLMVAVLDMDKVAANVRFLQRMGVVGLISLSDLKLHVGGMSTSSGEAEASDRGAIPIVNLSTE